VPLPNGEQIDLLKGVSGYFKPGTMTALMGSSGAGKTTLLDVIAGRKTSGTIKGDLYVNSAPIEMKSYSRVIVSSARIPSRLWLVFG
jgi:ABC-type multidrug transport system ATPase subunit